MFSDFFGIGVRLRLEAPLLSPFSSLPPADPGHMDRKGTMCKVISHRSLQDRANHFKRIHICLNV